MKNKEFNIDTESVRFKNNVNLEQREVVFHNPFLINQIDIENKIKEIDEMFDKNKFLLWAGNEFIKMQYAWSDRNLQQVRLLSTENFYEQMLIQINNYIFNKQINKLEKINIYEIKLYKFERKEDKEYLSVAVKAKMLDYIINEYTKTVLKGDKNISKINLYIVTFERTAGTKSTQKNIDIKTINCPNCGAKISIKSSEKCEYCGSKIINITRDWAISNLKRYTL